MAKKTNQVRWIIAIGVVVLLGVLIHSSIQSTRERYEVCMAFKGASHCSSAAGSNYNQAVRSAREIDCELLSNGRDENMVCLGGEPSSVRPVK